MHCKFSTLSIGCTNVSSFFGRLFFEFHQSMHQKLLAAGLIRAQFMAQWPKLPSGYVKIAIENGHL
jgi:hypothetical protein